MRLKPLKSKPRAKAVTGGIEANKNKNKKSPSLSSFAMDMINSADDDPEDAEIERLGKLLGVDKNSKRKAAAKLNKEYEQFEGIGDKFGDFLMDLDDLVDTVTMGSASIGRGKESKDSGADDDDDDERADVDDEDDSEPLPDEESDIEYDEGDMERDDEDDEEEKDEEEGEEETGQGRSPRADFTYKPSKGEDIYGRSSDAPAAAVAYVPPSRRLQEKGLAALPDSAAPLKRTINGLMNKLSEQSKDSVAKEMKRIYETNSVTVVNTIFKDCILAACSSKSQLMSTLIPLYACLVCALHHLVGINVSAFIVETLCVTFVKEIDEKENGIKKDSDHEEDAVGNKLPFNSLLLIAYMYNLRILHHALVVDLIHLLAKGDSQGVMDDQAIELLMCVVTNCGVQLRGDDPGAFKDVLTTLGGNASRADSTSSRVKLMVETLLDLKNNKSKRAANDNTDNIKRLRKWLGSVKSSANQASSSSSSSAVIRVPLKDILDAEMRGRWWRAGASWQGVERPPSEVGILESTNDVSTQASVKEASSEDQKLLKLAQKLNFNTSSRKSIFVVVMSSRDLGDAFERLCRLNLKGKQDRELVRVVVECCAHEKVYNPFYAELISLMCEQNRQFKSTAQFTFWDFFKQLKEETLPDKKIVNLAKLLSHLVCAFHLPLAILKPIEMSDLTERQRLFMTTFFTCLFNDGVAGDVLQIILDRVATTKDFDMIRENVLYFLQKIFVKPPDGLSSQEAARLMKKRKAAIRTMEALEVIKYAMDRDGRD